MKTFFLVLARDENCVIEKIEELQHLQMPFLVVCGKRINHPNLVYREPIGKYDAINFGFEFIPKDVDVVALNDVDTRIEEFGSALRCFNLSNVGLVFARIRVKEGPQRLFYRILDSIRRRYPIVASGELMLVRYDVLKRILPIKPCKAEDTYILFKVMQQRHKCVFCEESYVETVRTKKAEEEEAYKRRTVSGIYQALAYTKPPYAVKLFYMFLPLVCPLLLVSGEKGYFWMKGILLGLIDYLRGDRTAVWQPT